MSNWNNAGRLGLGQLSDSSHITPTDEWTEDTRSGTSTSAPKTADVPVAGPSSSTNASKAITPTAPHVPASPATAPQSFLPSSICDSISKNTLTPELAAFARDDWSRRVTGRPRLSAGPSKSSEIDNSKRLTMPTSRDMDFDINTAASSSATPASGSTSLQQLSIGNGGSARDETLGKEIRAITPTSSNNFAAERGFHDRTDVPNLAPIGEREFGRRVDNLPFYYSNQWVAMNHFTFQQMLSIGLPTTHVEGTRDYRIKLRNTCRMSLNQERCRSTAACYGPKGQYHVCDEFNKHTCTQGGPAAIHGGGIHTSRECVMRRNQDCGRPDCFDPHGAQLVHVRYSCFSFRKGVACMKDGPVADGGTCEQAHDNADIRRGVSASRYQGRQVIPDA